MHPGSDPLGAAPSFTARRPNASNLPNFELPPPPLSGLQKYQPFATINGTQPSPVPTNAASVGNLLTPPTNLPGDGLSPVSGVTGSSSNSTQNLPPYTPNGVAWSPNGGGNTPYGFQSQHQHHFNAPRGTSAMNEYDYRRGTHQYSAGLPPPPYESNGLPSFSNSMSAPPSSMPTMSAQHHVMSHPMMQAPTPVSASSTQPSPIHTQHAFETSRPPQTPSSYSQPSYTPQQSTFPYSTGPSPTQPSPMSAGGPMRMSPANTQGPIPSLASVPQHSPHAYQRPFSGSYPPGPVMSNIGNPNGQMALVGQPMILHSGHAASMQHMYGGHHPAQPTPPNDRPFKCDQCPQSFNRNHDLKRHKRIHLAVKPFPCGHCDKSFSRKDALKVSATISGRRMYANNDYRGISLLKAAARLPMAPMPKSKTTRCPQQTRAQSASLPTSSRRTNAAVHSPVLLMSFPLFSWMACILHSAGRVNDIDIWVMTSWILASTPTEKDLHGNVCNGNGNLTGVGKLSGMVF